MAGSNNWGNTPTKSWDGPFAGFLNRESFSRSLEEVWLLSSVNYHFLPIFVQSKMTIKGDDCFGGIHFHPFLTESLLEKTSHTKKGSRSWFLKKLSVVFSR